MGVLMRILPIYLAAVTILTFGVYGYDKRQARRHRRRVPEATLHLLALLGGTPGAFAGQRVFHHKTRKRRFMAVFVVIALAQAAGVVWWYFKMHEFF